jgi:hypothetical protein
MTTPAEYRSEEWRPVEGSRGYEVSNIGRTRSRLCVLRHNSIRGYDYIRVTMADGSRRSSRVHVLVLTAFSGPRPPGLIARHLDGNQKNNRACNLVWGTHVENEGDKNRHGTAVRGERHGMSRLKWADVAAIRWLHSGGCSHGELAKVYGVSRSHIGKICIGRAWHHAS